MDLCVKLTNNMLFKSSVKGEINLCCSKIGRFERFVNDTVRKS